METGPFSTLRATVSGERLGPYLTACAGDQAAAARLYAWNIRASSGLVGCTSIGTTSHSTENCQ